MNLAVRLFGSDAEGEGSPLDGGAAPGDGGSPDKGDVASGVPGTGASSAGGRVSSSTFASPFVAGVQLQAGHRLDPIS